MHILAILSAIVTILVLVKRLSDAGIDIGWLNPFLWHRRRSWRKRHDAHPVHAVDEPMALTAILMLATARASGEVTREQKAALLGHFQTDFHLSSDQAERLLGSSAFLLGDGVELDAKLEQIVERRLEAFTAGQAVSAVALCASVARSDSLESRAQTTLLKRIERAFEPRCDRAPQATWA